MPRGVSTELKFEPADAPRIPCITVAGYRLGSRLTVLPTDPHDAACGQSLLYPMGFFEARLRNSERHAGSDCPTTHVTLQRAPA